MTDRQVNTETTMYTTPEARPMSASQYEQAKQTEQARRWYLTGRSWVDVHAFARFMETWTPPSAKGIMEAVEGKTLSRF